MLAAYVTFHVEKAVAAEAGAAIASTSASVITSPRSRRFALILRSFRSFSCVVGRRLLYSTVIATTCFTQLPLE